MLLLLIGLINLTASSGILKVFKGCAAIT